MLRDPVNAKDRPHQTHDARDPRKLDECEGRLSKMLVDSATDKSEVNSPIKAAQQEGSNEVV